MITINLDKAKNLVHESRRIARENEFKPFDDIISKQIPTMSFSDAEASRVQIREKYIGIQNRIDSATSIDELKTIKSEENI